jgi:hypothetical protein
VTSRDVAHLRSFVCAAGHELRVTARCLTNDLSDSALAPFEELVNRHGIVKAFKRERNEATVGTDYLGTSSRTDRLLTVLRHQHHWRAVTWFDEETSVVWLCACRRHRSGETDDAFPHFEALRDADIIWPSEADYEALAADRGEQFAVLAVTEGPALLDRARNEPNKEHRIEIGLERVGIVVVIVETLEETYIAVSGLNLTFPLLLLLMGALFDRPFDDWRPESRLPNRDLDYAAAELCFSIISERPNLGDGST